MKCAHKRFKLLARLVHPDKCRHPLASSAYASISTADRIISDGAGGSKAASFVGN